MGTVGQLPCIKKDLASEAKLRTMNYSCSSYLCRYPFTSPTSLRWTEGAVDSEKRCRTGRAQTEVPRKVMEPQSVTGTEHLGSPLLATQRNPAHRMMSPGPIGIRPYNLPYNKCSRNISTASGPTRYSVQNRFQSRSGSCLLFSIGSCPEWTFGQLPCSITTLKTIFCIY